MTAAFGLRTSTPAYAAPCPKPPTVTVPKPAGEKPDVPVVPPAATPTPTPDAGEPEEDNPGLLGQIVDGITGLFDGDSAKDPAEKEGAADPTPEPATTAKPAAVEDRHRANEAQAHQGRLRAFAGVVAGRGPADAAAARRRGPAARQPHPVAAHRLEADDVGSDHRRHRHAAHHGRRHPGAEVHDEPIAGRRLRPAGAPGRRPAAAHQERPAGGARGRRVLRDPLRRPVSRRQAHADPRLAHPTGRHPTDRAEDRVHRPADPTRLRRRATPSRRRRSTSRSRPRPRSRRHPGCAGPRAGTADGVTRGGPARPSAGRGRASPGRAPARWNSFRSKSAPLRALASSRAWSQIRSPTLYDGAWPGQPR